MALQDLGSFRGSLCIRLPINLGHARIRDRCPGEDLIAKNSGGDQPEPYGDAPAAENHGLVARTA